MRSGSRLAVIVAALALMIGMVVSSDAQVGKSLGVGDVNVIAPQDLLTLPHMTPAIVKTIVEKRPFNSITELNLQLMSQGLSAAQAMDFYTKAFVHINL